MRNLEAAVPLGGYVWHTNSNFLHNATNMPAFVLPLAGYGLASPPRTHVRTITTCSAAFSMSPTSGDNIASNVAEGLSVRMMAYYWPFAGNPPLVDVNPFETLPTTDTVLGWSELVATSVVLGAFGSFTVMYGLPDGVLDIQTYRKMTAAHTSFGVCIAVNDTQGNWGFPSVDPVYSWSASVGQRTLTALES